MSKGIIWLDNSETWRQLFPTGFVDYITDEGRTGSFEIVLNYMVGMESGWYFSAIGDCDLQSGESYEIYKNNVLLGKGVAS